MAGDNPRIVQACFRPDHTEAARAAVAEVVNQSAADATMIGRRGDATAGRKNFADSLRDFLCHIRNSSVP